MMREHDGEPVRGLPGRLPEGERILWQGSPDWRALAVRALHLRLVGGYFALVVAWRGVEAAAGGATLISVLSGMAATTLAGVVCVAILSFYGWLSARAAVYTITNKRVVLRHGVALSKAFNIPFTVIASAGLKADARGLGDVALALLPPNKVAYPHLWPHVRPGRFSRPEPMFRAVVDAPVVARVLMEAVRQEAEAAGRPFAGVAPQAAPAAPQPAAPRAAPVAA